MGRSDAKTWALITIVVLAGSVATALVPLTVPILRPIASEFHVAGANLGWIVSFPTLVCALGALLCGVIVDRTGDVRLLLAGMVLVILGDIAASLAPRLWLLFAARLFEGFGYVCLSVAGPAFIQRTTAGETRRAAMAFWAAHTPVGFAAMIFFGSQLVAAGLSWRISFLGHAAVALAVGLTVLILRGAGSAAQLRRSAGTLRVLTSGRPYAVAVGAAATGMIQVSVMTLVPSLLAGRFSFSPARSALVVVIAMLACWCGSMAVVATPLRHRPSIGLPVSAALAAVLGYFVVSDQFAGSQAVLACVMGFAAAIGCANSLVWSLIPAAVPSPDAAGATAGLITQGSFLGVLVGPPTYFWLRQDAPGLLAVVSIVLALLMIVPLFACPRRSREPAATPLATDPR